MFYTDQALSVRALQEMMRAENPHEQVNFLKHHNFNQVNEVLFQSGGGGGHRTLLYGHAVQLKHVLSSMVRYKILQNLF